MSAFTNYKRRIYVVDKESQIKFTIITIGSLVSFALLVVLIIWLPSYLAPLSESDAGSKVIAQEFSHLVEGEIIPATLVFLLLVSLFTIFHTHKIFGPVYRFQHSTKRLENGDLKFSIVLRKWDYLKGLQNSMNSFISSLRNKVISMKKSVSQLNQDLNNLKISMAKGELNQEHIQIKLDSIANHINKLDKHLVEFNVDEEDKS